MCQTELSLIQPYKKQMLRLCLSKGGAYRSIISLNIVLYHVLSLSPIKEKISDNILMTMAEMLSTLRYVPKYTTSYSFISCPSSGIFVRLRTIGTMARMVRMTRSTVFMSLIFDIFPLSQAFLRTMVSRIPTALTSSHE